MENEIIEDTKVQEDGVESFKEYEPKHGKNWDPEDNFNQPFYPRKEGDDLVNILKANVQNIHKLVKYFRENSDEIWKVLETGNLTILSNHGTWLNLPILAYALHEGLGIEYEELYIILGPAITLNKQFRELVRQVANLMKTWPPTIKPVSRKVRVTVLSNFKKTVKKEISEKTGKIILFSPSGTTDDPENGMRDPVEGVIKLIKSMAYYVLYLPINDLEIFHEKNLQKGDIYFKSSGIKKAPESLEEYRREMLKLIPIISKGRNPANFYTLNEDKQVVKVAS
jgi:hypothetical protein